MMLEKIAHIMKTKGGVDDWNSDYQNNKQVILICTLTASCDSQVNI